MASIEILGTLAAGVVSYWGFFHQGEHTLYATRYLQLFGLTVLTGAIFQTQQANITFSQALLYTLRLGIIYLSGVYSNCVIYRLFLNPLNKFPGPYWARLSKFDHVFRNVKLDGHLVLLRLHEKYGKYVRIGPNDLSVIDADGTQVISAPNSKCTKGPWYANDTPLISLHTTRDRAAHDRRRRIWAPAFSDKALRGYENRVQTINDMLISKLKETNGRVITEILPICTDKYSGKSVDASNLLNLYSFDVMGDLAFGRSFNMVESGKVHWAIKLLNAGMDPLGFSFPSWFFRLVAAIPGASKGYWDFVGFCTKQLEDRIAVHGKTDPAKPDITQTLIEHYNKSSDKKELWPMMCGDSRLIIVAGSDTTAATLTYLFYHIASKPEWQEKLREEIHGVKQKHMNEKEGTVILDQWLKDEDQAPILNGMINETLRLNPPVPSGVFRKTPSEGVNIGTTFIPGDTVIQMPQYVMSRCKFTKLLAGPCHFANMFAAEDNYARANEFVPDRWREGSTLIKHKDAFAPFSTGPFGCIGKNLAYMEVRTITVQLVDQFDISLAPGEDGKKLLMKSTDHFTLELAELNLIFKRRD